MNDGIFALELNNESFDVFRPDNGNADIDRINAKINNFNTYGTEKLAIIKHIIGLMKQLKLIQIKKILKMETMLVKIL